MSEKIETIINTCAIALTATGTMWVTQGTNLLKGAILILFGVALEFFKYWGRKQTYW